MNINNTYNIAKVAIAFILCLFWGNAFAQEAVELVVNRGHSSEIISFSMRPDGAYMASSSANEVLITHLKTGTEIYRFEDHKAPIHIVGFSPDGSYTFSCDTIGTVIVRDFQTGKTVLQWNHPNKTYLGSIEVSDDNTAVLMVDKDRTCHIIDIQKGTSIPSDGGLANAAIFTQDGGSIILGDFFNAPDEVDVASSNITKKLLGRKLSESFMSDAGKATKITKSNRQGQKEYSIDFPYTLYASQKTTVNDPDTIVNVSLSPPNYIVDKQNYLYTLLEVVYTYKENQVDTASVATNEQASNKEFKLDSAGNRVSAKLVKKYAIGIVVWDVNTGELLKFLSDPSQAIPINPLNRVPLPGSDLFISTYIDTKEVYLMGSQASINRSFGLQGGAEGDACYTLEERLVSGKGLEIIPTLKISGGYYSEQLHKETNTYVSVGIENFSQPEGKSTLTRADRKEADLIRRRSSCMILYQINRDATTIQLKAYKAAGRPSNIASYWISPDNYVLFKKQDQIMTVWSMNTHSPMLCFLPKEQKGDYLRDEKRYREVRVGSLGINKQESPLDNGLNFNPGPGLSARIFGTTEKVLIDYGVVSRTQKTENLFETIVKNKGIVIKERLSRGKYSLKMKDIDENSGWYSPALHCFMFATQDKTIHVWDFRNDKIIATYSNAQVLLNGRYILQGNRLYTTDQPKEEAFVHEILSNKQKLFANIVNYDLTETYCLSEVEGEYVLWSIFETDALASFNKSKVNPASFLDFSVNLTSSSLQFGDVSRKSTLSFLPVGLEDWVLSDKENYYTATREAIASIGLKQGINVFALDQFDVKLNRPDRLFQNFPAIDKKLLGRYEEAFQKRLHKMNLKEEAFSEALDLPQVTIVNREDLEGVHPDSTVNLQIHVSDEKEFLERVDIWVNGVPVLGQDGHSLRSLQTKITDFTEKIVLSSGINKIQVSATNQQGGVSLKAEIQLDGSEPYTVLAWKRPDIYIIGIGASAYSDNKWNLKYAQKDIRDIINTFSSAKKKELYFRNIIIDTLLNENVTVENIKEIKEKLLKSNVNDRVMIFYSGHGLLDNNFNYYLATHNTDFGNPQNGGLPYETLEWLLDGIPARKKSIFMDACHSGELDEAVVEIDTTKAVVEDVDFRSATAGNTKIKELGTAFQLMKELFVDLRRGSGTTVVSSAGGAEYALEGADWGNGAFTYAFLTLGIGEMQADLDGNGIIMLSEMKAFLADIVPYLTNGKQQPTSRQDNQDIDFRIW